jgi:hypothetical protein
VIKLETQKEKYQLTPTSLHFVTKTVLEGFNNIWYKPYKDNLGIVRYKKKYQKV